MKKSTTKTPKSSKSLTKGRSVFPKDHAVALNLISGLKWPTGENIAPEFIPLLGDAFRGKEIDLTVIAEKALSSGWEVPEFLAPYAPDHLMHATFIPPKVFEAISALESAVEDVNYESNNGTTLDLETSRRKLRAAQGTLYKEIRKIMRGPGSLSKAELDSLDPSHGTSAKPKWKGTHSK